MKLTVLLILALITCGCATTPKHSQAYTDYMTKIDEAVANKQITELEATKMRFEANTQEEQRFASERSARATRAIAASSAQRAAIANYNAIANPNND